MPGIGPQIVVIGSHAPGLLIRVQRVPVAGETVIGWDFEEPKDGGKGSNQAIASARLGVFTSFVGGIGRDHLGIKAESWLKEEGVDVNYLYSSKSKSTGVGFNILNESGVPATLARFRAARVAAAAGVAVAGVAVAGAAGPTEAQRGSAGAWVHVAAVAATIATVAGVAGSTGMAVAGVLGRIARLSGSIQKAPAGWGWRPPITGRPGPPIPPRRRALRRRAAAVHSCATPGGEHPQPRPDLGDQRNEEEGRVAQEPGRQEFGHSAGRQSCHGPVVPADGGFHAEYSHRPHSRADWRPPPGRRYPHRHLH